jgi:hypothetical protein
MHSYYHLVPLVLSYFSVGYLSDSRYHLVILTGVVSGCITFNEAPHLAQKCGTGRSDNSVRAL